MTLDEFRALIYGEVPAVEIVASMLVRPVIPACGTAQRYADFKSVAVDVLQLHGLTPPNVHIVGSGNWGYSLSPYKLFQQFSIRSDIDVAIISEAAFMEIWCHMRNAHRRRWSDLGKKERMSLAQDGNRVYEGRISPLWIPNRRGLRFSWARKLHDLSGELVDYRRVNALIFRNSTELHEYYSRGVVLARRTRWNTM